MVSVFGLVARGFKRDFNGNRAICVRSYEIYLRRDDPNVGVSGRSKRVVTFSVCRTVNVINQVNDSTGATSRIMNRFRFIFPRVIIGLFLFRQGCACDGASSLRVPFNGGFFF